MEADNRKARVKSAIRQAYWLMVSVVRPLLAGSLVLLMLGSVVMLWMEPIPPQQISIATGPAGGDFDRLGRSYADVLEGYGIRVKLVPTAGGEENHAMVLSGQVDVGFVQDGLAAGKDVSNIVSLGQLYPQPLWVFFREDMATRSRRSMHFLQDFSGLRVNLGAVGSGCLVTVRKLLNVSRMRQEEFIPSYLAPKVAVEKILANQLDVVVLSEGVDSVNVQKLLNAPGIEVMDFQQAEAYSRLMSEIMVVKLPKGVVNLQSHRPKHSVHLLASSVSLLAEEKLHPALSALLVQVAVKVHESPSWFQHWGEFPKATAVDVPLDDDAAYVYQHGPSRWGRWLPFWAANVMDRAGLLLLSVALVLMPLVKFAPKLYVLEVHWRIYRGYRRLKQIDEMAQHKEVNWKRLEELVNALDAEMARLEVPSWNSAALYALRSHIALVQRHVQAGVVAQSTLLIRKSE